MINIFNSSLKLLSSFVTMPLSYAFSLIPYTLLSRFVMINVEEYSYEEFKEIAIKVLIEREHMKDKNLAMTIINEVWKNMVEDTNANMCDVIYFKIRYSDTSFDDVMTPLL
jgi:hypothetical protein